jgi:hypothetical protein
MAANIPISTSAVLDSIFSYIFNQNNNFNQSILPIITIIIVMSPPPASGSINDIESYLYQKILLTFNWLFDRHIFLFYL